MEVKLSGHNANHSSPFNTELKNAWSYTSTAPSWRGGYISTATTLHYLLFPGNNYKYSPHHHVRNSTVAIATGRTAGVRFMSWEIFISSPQHQDWL
jgi:hypothetical protein